MSHNPGHAILTLGFSHRRRSWRFTRIALRCYILKLVGRPSSYTSAVAAEICDQIADGKSLVSICAAENLPCFKTVFNWFASQPEFLQQYARAKEIQAERMAEDIIRISDEADAESYNPARLQVDTRKWLLSKMLPKKYGDATLLKHADADGNSMKIEVTRVKRKE